MERLREEALQRDGDGYFTRNHSGIGTIADPAFDQMSILHAVSPITSVFEVGCTTGFRLEKARKAFGAAVAGIEISPAAVAEGRRLYPQVRLEEGLAPRDLHHFDDSAFDVVIVGHLLYLLPREDLFSLAAAVDRLLMAGGHLIVMDFIHPRPMSAPYTHDDALTVFKHDPSAPWLWSPTYTLVGREVFGNTSPRAGLADPRAWQTVDVLRKLSIDESYPISATLPSIHESTE